MTKIQLQFDLVRPLKDEDAQALSDIHGQYGFYRVQPAPALDKLNVEYDASRLSEKDVEAALVRKGLPIVRKFAGVI